MCDAKVLLWPDRGDGDGPGIATCDRTLESPHSYHEGQIMATRVSWDEYDRRTFRGDLVMCDTSGCQCPINHRGNHAL